MKTVLLIIQREYLSRVLKKSFLVMTFLVPALFIGMYTLVFYISKKNEAKKTKFYVIDDSKLFQNNLKNAASISFTYVNEEPKEFLKNKDKVSETYLLYIHPDFITSRKAEIISGGKPNYDDTNLIIAQLEEILHYKKLQQSGIDPKILVKEKINLSFKSNLKEESKKNARPEAIYIIGFLSSFLIYMSLLIYGMQVMRGVLEEKSSRIIEVIISSVKPFQLMLGKILGIGAVGLTQFLLWIIFSTGLGLLSKNSLLGDKFNVETLLAFTANINLSFILACFLFYFLSGYLLYSAMFAAVGSAVDSETETQQFMIPITLPLIFAFIIGLNVIIKNPDSNLSFWLSMFPLTSPIAMMIRIPFGVPSWQILLSMFLLIAGFIVITWLASRIYRIGILMYGKKTSYKEILKWIKYKP